MTCGAWWGGFTTGRGLGGKPMPDLTWFICLFLVEAAAVYTALLAHDRWGKR